MQRAFIPAPAIYNIMPDIAATLRDAAMQLEAVSDTPRLDAELLMAHVLNMERGQMLLHKMAHPAPAVFGPALLRRLAHEPIAYIIGETEFWSLPISVTPDVLIPRSDSETLIDAALAECHNHPPHRILDLGTGSGALLCAALSEWPAAQGVAIDASASALRIAQQNLQRLNMAERTSLIRCNWRDTGWQKQLNTRFDLILCNPPYVEDMAKLDRQVHEYEPHDALFSGPQGLDDYRILIPHIADLLTPHGLAIFELGQGQSPQLIDIAQQAGLSSVVYKDLARIDRAIILRAN